MSPVLLSPAGDTVFVRSCPHFSLTTQQRSDLINQIHTTVRAQTAPCSIPGLLASHRRRLYITPCPAATCTAIHHANDHALPSTSNPQVLNMARTTALNLLPSTSQRRNRAGRNIKATRRHQRLSKPRRPEPATAPEKHECNVPSPAPTASTAFPPELPRKPLTVENLRKDTQQTSPEKLHAMAGDSTTEKSKGSRTLNNEETQLGKFGLHINVQGVERVNQGPTTNRKPHPAFIATAIIAPRATSCMVIQAQKLSCALLWEQLIFSVCFPHIIPTPESAATASIPP